MKPKKGNFADGRGGSIAAKILNPPRQTRAENLIETLQQMNYQINNSPVPGNFMGPKKNKY